MKQENGRIAYFLVLHQIVKNTAALLKSLDLGSVLYIFFPFCECSNIPTYTYAHSYMYAQICTLQTKA